MSFLSSPDTFIATLLGGFLAGITGLLISRYDRRLRRREAHLREHKENFEVIQEALVQLKSLVWPLTAKGSENMVLPRWEKPPFAFQLKNYSISNFQWVEMEQRGDVRGIGGNSIRITTVDKVLYSDISTHFPELSAQLGEIERMVKTEGVRLDELAYLVSKTIYSNMASSDIPVLRFSFDQGKRATMREIPLDGLEGLQYAGWLFLLLIGEDPGKWPNEYGNLKRYGLLGGLERLTAEIKAKVSSELTELLKLRQGLFSNINSCIEAIEQQRHRMTMKHGCEYL